MFGAYTDTYFLPWTSMSPCEPLAQRMFVCMEPPWAQRGLQTGVGGGGGGGAAAAAGDLKGNAVRRSASRTTPRGTLMFPPASKGKQMGNERWHQAWATGAKTSGNESHHAEL